MTPAEESRKRRDYDALLSSRDKSISPPPKRHAFTVNERPGRAKEENWPSKAVIAAAPSIVSSDKLDNHSKPHKEAMKPQARSIFQSPVQLNFIEELSASSNVDCVSLGSILGDPMIKECWLFNYLFDMDFVMRQFDHDTRDLVQVRVVHGSWKKEDSNGIRIEDASKRNSNIKVIKAYMPEMFGTHHTKAMVLFRHDDLAQVVILTANFIEIDFRMSQAIWRTPLLPFQTDVSPSNLMPPLGSGPRFKHDLLAYFRGYSRNGTAILSDLISQLQNYDFSAVRGALVGSLPGTQMPGQSEPEEQDRIGRWGLPALRRILRSITTNSSPSDLEPQPQIVIQISSVASFGEKWLLSTFIPTLSTSKSSLNSLPNPLPNPKISIIFPTTTSIRNSIDGYGSGTSIHMKTTSASQAKQLSVLKPMLCHWSKHPHPTSLNHPPSHHQEAVRQTHRGRAAPHIKTYIRFSDTSMTSIDWALMTSANLSTQAWGSAPNARGDVKISSYELGVLVWPALWDDPAAPGTATMVPVFGRDMPPDDAERYAEPGKERVKVGWRMPYDLPLVPYDADEKPWCASEPCDEPDWMGRVWPSYGH